MNLLRSATITLQERALRWLRNAERKGDAAGSAAHLEVGNDGEDAAFFELRRKGYVVVARRWSSGESPGDIDLIAWKNSLLCFVEVKTRTAHDDTPAESAVDWAKRKTIRKLARVYLRQLLLEPSPEVRFDVMSVYLLEGKPPEFVHFEAAFGLSEQSPRA